MADNLTILQALNKTILATKTYTDSKLATKVDKEAGKGLSTNDLTSELLENYNAAYAHSQTNHFSGDYNDLINKPTIPSKISELTNDSDLTTKQYVDDNEPAKVLGESEIITISAADLQSSFNTEEASTASIETRAIGTAEYITSIDYTLTNYKNKKIIVTFMGETKEYIPRKDEDDIYIIEGHCDDYAFYILFGMDENEQPNVNKTIIIIYFFNEDASLVTDCIIKEKEFRKLNNDFLENDVTILNSLTIGTTELTDDEKGLLSFTNGYNNNAIGDYSHAEGNCTTASGNASHSEGNSTNKATNVITNLSTSTPNDDIIDAWDSDCFSLAKGTASHAEGGDTLALGNYSHAEGQWTVASGEKSHAEGDSTTANGSNSHSEGYGTTATALASHAEGLNTIANGNQSHAEGENTVANGSASHVEGNYTIAASDNQHVQGKYNIEDTTSTYAHIVGNGTNTDDRSNAHTLDWNGNAWFAGNVTIGTDNKKLATQEYVDNKTINFYEGTENDPVILSELTNGSFIVDGYYKWYPEYENNIVAIKTMFHKAPATGDNFYILRMNGHEPTRYAVNMSTKTVATGRRFTVSNQVLERTNTDKYTPTDSYHPATKKYVDDAITGVSGGSDFSGDYNDLTNKPTIPSIDGLATETYVNNAVAGLVDSAPETLDTLKELSTALGNDANFATTVANQIGNKVDKIEGKGLSTNDLTNALKANYDIAYTHSQSVHAPSNAQKNSDITKAEIEAKLTGNIATHTHSQYLTEHQSLAEYAKTTDLHTHTNKTVLDGISSTNISNWNSAYTHSQSEHFSGNYNDLTNKPTSLPANGGNADTVGGYTIWSGTQAQYDAITTKDANTIYIIKGE